MHFHVYIFERFAEQRGRGRLGQGYYFTNLSEDQLRDRVVAAWDRGGQITWSGRTADSLRALNIKIFETEEPLSADILDSDAFRLMEERGREVTNDWILGPAGEAPQAPAEADAGNLPDPTKVMIVHGRNTAARDAIASFLRVLHLSPIEWEEAVAATGLGAPHNLAVVQAALRMAQAVVVLLTAEDEARLMAQLAGGEVEPLAGQPRQNVTLEAGMAMGVAPERTILVQLGTIRGASDFDGLNVVRLTNEPEQRSKLRTRLRNAGCAVNDAGEDWLRSPVGGDFEAVVHAPVGDAPAEEPMAAQSWQESVVAIPHSALRSGASERASLGLRYIAPPDGVQVTCHVTSSAGEVSTAAAAVPAGGDSMIYELTFPDDFDGGIIVAGHHAVVWNGTLDGQTRELATDNFRFP